MRLTHTDVERQVKGKIKEPEFELPPGASPQYAKALRKEGSPRRQEGRPSGP